MALVIEDGSIVPGANSYVTVAEMRTYALQRGVTLPAADADLEVLSFQAVDYLESFRSSYKGSIVDTAQALQWPRQNVVIDGQPWPIIAIPKELKSAQCQSVIEVFNGFDLMPSQDNFAEERIKVDVIEVQYATGGNRSGAQAPYHPKFPKVDAVLDPLLNNVSMLKAYRS